MFCDPKIWLFGPLISYTELFHHHYDIETGWRNMMSECKRGGALA